MTDLTTLDITEARALMQDGRLTPRDLVRACLARIAERDRDVRAWIAVNPRAEAEATKIAASDPRPLAGIPFGVKDVIDTADLATTHNSPLYPDRCPGEDAPCVQTLRAAGAILLGKTDTTEFAAAGRDAATANPWDTAHTAGGSSAGSAAAVADRHVPLALGTQTGGSTIRPGSFNGVPAMKPSWGLISAEGVKLYAQSLDTVGMYAKSHRDLRLVADVYGLPTGQEPSARPRLALCATPYSDKLEPEMRDLLEGLAARMRPAAEVTRMDLPTYMDDIDALHRCVQMSEGAAAFRNLDARDLPLLHPDFRDRARRVEGHSIADMFRAYDRLADYRREVEAMMDGFDAIIAPAAPGFAPKGRGPGNPVFNALWTAMQMPCVNIPVAGEGLPLGVQLVGRRGTDVALLHLAETLAPILAAYPTLQETVA
jgi:Asp-tRNA(Asn)/Glu-tRNA(Gln) amidotransferase A subunit family amidase